MKRKSFARYEFESRNKQHFHIYKVLLCVRIFSSSLFFPLYRGVDENRNVCRSSAKHVSVHCDTFVDSFFIRRFSHIIRLQIQ